MKKYAWLALILVAVFAVGLTAIFIASCDENGDGGNEDQYNVTTTEEFKSAIENQKDGDVLKIKNGTYNICAVITKNIKIIGESKNGVIISGPEDFTKIEKHDKVAQETMDLCGLIVIKNCDAEIRNVTIKGDATKAGAAANITSNRFAGIMVIESNLVMENVNVLDTNFSADKIGIQNGYGVYAVAPAGGNKIISIKDCKFENFNKGAVYIKENYGNLTFTGNEIKGYGKTDKIAQNGLLFACKATIKNNTFKDLKYDSETVWSVGVFAAYLTEETFENSTIENNTFQNVQREQYQMYADAKTAKNKK